MADNLHMLPKSADDALAELAKAIVELQVACQPGKDSGERVTSILAAMSPILLVLAFLIKRLKDLEN